MLICFLAKLWQTGASLNDLLSDIMKHAKSLGRTLLLILLFLLGIGLIWKVGHNSGWKEDPVTETAAVPVEPIRTPPAAAQNETNVARSILPEGPPPEILDTSRGRFISTDPILFNSGLTSLREASISKLDRIAAFLIRKPGIAVEIIGHTDNLGPEPVNQVVSADRAEIVMNYLISQGIDPSRLRSKGMGSVDPIESNDTQLGRQANRRIEFLIREGAAAAAER